jgi:hypothetical protein
MMEEIGDLVVNGQKFLRLARRFEPLHDPLSSSRRLIRIFCPVVEAFMLAIFDAQPHRRSGRAVRFQPVSDYHARSTSRLF